MQQLQNLLHHLRLKVCKMGFYEIYPSLVHTLGQLGKNPCHIQSASLVGLVRVRSKNAIWYLLLEVWVSGHHIPSCPVGRLGRGPLGGAILVWQDALTACFSPSLPPSLFPSLPPFFSQFILFFSFLSVKLALGKNWTAFTLL